jgi:RND family efflux transporter MFP subunit
MTPATLVCEENNVLREQNNVQRKALPPATLLIVGVAAAVLVSCSAKITTPSVALAPVVRAAVTETVQVPGVLAPSRTAVIYSSTPGNAGAVKAEIGDRVRVGEVLIRLDTRRLAARLQAANAAVRSVEDRAKQAKLGIATAKANLALARKSYDRAKALFAANATTQSRFDDVQNRYQLAKNAYENAVSQYRLLSGSSLAEAKAEANLIQVQINDGTIISPIDGVVTNRNINPGEVVNMGVPLMTVADTSVLKLHGTVSQNTVPAIRLGQEATILVDGKPNTSFAGNVTQIGPVAVSTGQYFPIVVTLTNPGGLLAGMTATAVLEITGPKTLVVPTTALRTINGVNYVYTVRSGIVRRRKVMTGIENESEIQIAGNLSAGDRVAVSNVSILHDGMTVQTR